MKELKALLRFAKPYRWFLALATLSMIMVTVMNMIAPWMIRNLIKIVTDGGGGQINVEHVSLLALAALIVYILRAISQFGSDYISHYSAWHILNDIRHYMYDHMEKLPLKYFQDRQTGELMSRVINDTRNFEQLLAHAVPTIIVNAL
jgi:ABC transporter transmembrane region.